MVGDDYDSRYDRAAAAGENVHGEADFVMRFTPRSVLDAGCGTGRVGRELARRGVDVVGVDLDPDMLVTARRKAPAVPWVVADLAELELGRTFDLVIAAGNVMILLTPDSEAEVVRRIARHLPPGGRLVAGFSRREHLSPERYDALATEAGLALEERWSTWDREAWRADADYVLSVHRLGSPTPRVAGIVR
ncbi:MAG: class I SAM-dependent methyltransferase [Chloroflexi bacterium]|nr:class I SAM-dependent methyltransferase [Chloroflexota bacterium]